jgi:DNA-binding NarL/FixJ family response regulator
VLPAHSSFHVQRASVAGASDAAERPIRVLIAADHPLVRRGLRALLRVTPGLELEGEAAGFAAASAAAELRPDVVLLDVAVPELEGVATIREIKRAYSQARVVALATFDEPGLALSAARAGADRYLLKDVGVADLVQAIRFTASPSLCERATPRSAPLALPERENCERAAPLVLLAGIVP